MNKVRIALMVWLAGIAVLNAAFFGIRVGTQRWGFAALALFACAACTSGFLLILKGDSHGRHRQAEGDRDDPGPSADPELTLTLDPGAIYGPGVTFSPGITSWYSAVPALSAAEGTGPGLAERQQDEPITAWKQARLAFAGGRYYFLPLTGVGGSGYDVEAVARCVAVDFGSALYSYQGIGVGSAPHTAPSLDCSCGFYALTEPPEDDPSLCLLEVDLYGRVIVCEKGYRAEKQRVLAVTVPTRCYYCTETETHFVVFGEGEALGVRCGAHTPTDAIVVSVEQVAGVLGTEVRRATS